MQAPKNGDMYRCKKCAFEVRVTKDCDCDDCKTELKCCDQAMKEVTKPSVQNR